MPPVIGLLTDFGLKDHYVGVMKAVMLGLCPDAVFVDITHNVAPQAVDQGAFSLEQAATHFPTGAVFLCVVDPGVGSPRKAVAVKAGGYHFVAPDNGLLSRVLERTSPPERIVELQVPAGSSNTFHGRDVFAPAAARLAAGVPIESLGPALPSLRGRARGTATVGAEELVVTVLSIDHFGNVIFDFSRETGWEPPRTGRLFVVEGRERVPFAPTYAAVRPGESLLLWNASGHLELAVRDGDAASRWELRCGDRVKLRLGQE